MSFALKRTHPDDIVLLHDYYFESQEPDAPNAKFENLAPAEKSAVARLYPIENYFSVFKDSLLIGFIGFFPDDDLNVNIFYVLSPAYRRLGYFRELLKISIAHCRVVFSEFQYIRALTRFQNSASIKGLESCSFVRRGQVIEEAQPDVPYDEYVFPIKL